MPEAAHVEVIGLAHGATIGRFAVVASRSDPRRYSDNWGRPGDIGVTALAGDGRVLGAAWCRIFEEPASPWADITVPEAAVAVDEAERGRGVGRILMVELLERVRALGHAALELTVSGENASALELYQSLGFVTIGEDSTGRRWMRLGLDRA